MNNRRISDASFAGFCRRHKELLKTAVCTAFSIIGIGWAGVMYLTTQFPPVYF